MNTSNMLCSSVRLAGPAIERAIDLQLSPGDIMVPVGFVLRNDVCPLRNGRFGDPDGTGRRGSGFEVLQHVGFAHMGHSTAC
jgi:hypothetical protein